MTPAFLEWADERHLTDRVPAEVRAMVGDSSEPRRPARLEGDERLAAALMLERVGEMAMTRRALLSLFWRLPASPAALLMALKRLRTIDLYGRAKWTRPLFALAAHPRYATAVPE